MLRALSIRPRSCAAWIERDRTRPDARPAARSTSRTRGLRVRGAGADRGVGAAVVARVGALERPAAAVEIHERPARVVADAGDAAVTRGHADARATRASAHA